MQEKLAKNILSTYVKTVDLLATAGNAVLSLFGQEKSDCILMATSFVWIVSGDELNIFVQSKNKSKPMIEIKRKINSTRMHDETGTYCAFHCTGPDCFVVLTTDFERT